MIDVCVLTVMVLMCRWWCWYYLGVEAVVVFEGSVCDVRGIGESEGCGGVGLTNPTRSQQVPTASIVTDGDHCSGKRTAG